MVAIHTRRGSGSRKHFSDVKFSHVERRLYYPRQRVVEMLEGERSRAQCAESSVVSQSVCRSLSLGLWTAGIFRLSSGIQGTAAAPIPRGRISIPFAANASATLRRSPHFLGNPFFLSAWPPLPMTASNPRERRERTARPISRVEEGPRRTTRRRREIRLGGTRPRRMAEEGEKERGAKREERGMYRGDPHYGENAPGYLAYRGKRISSPKASFTWGGRRISPTLIPPSYKESLVPFGRCSLSRPASRLPSDKTLTTPPSPRRNV